MARAELRLATNVEGEFFVDESCIDCDACRQIAPGVFDRRGEQSAVVRQPDGANETLDAERALLACPTASIGTTSKRDLSRAITSFPMAIDGEVHFCGFTSESSFGAFSYLLISDGGNILIDSPRFNEPLVRNIASMGGVGLMVLTHIDDVADHEKFARRFGCRRVMHRRDAGKVPEIEMQPEGEEPIGIGDDLLMIPTPGHTRGHAVYLYRDRYLFTGDHLAWSPTRGHLYAFRGACWYSWERQIESMRKLLDYRFEWVLPGHGRPVRLDPIEMRDSLERAIGWMKSRA